MSIGKSSDEKAHSNKIILRLIISIVVLLFLLPAAIYKPLVTNIVLLATVALFIYAITRKKGEKK